MYWQKKNFISPFNQLFAVGMGGARTCRPLQGRRAEPGLTALRAALPIPFLALAGFTRLKSVGGQSDGILSSHPHPAYSKPHTAGFGRGRAPSDFARLVVRLVLVPTSPALLQAGWT